MVKSTTALVQEVFTKSAFRFENADPVTGMTTVRRGQFTAAEVALWQRLKAGYFLREENRISFSSGNNPENNTIVVNIYGEIMHFFPAGCNPCCCFNPPA